MNFQFSDTWLLHSILNTEKENGAEMKDIIAFADYTNHSIMNYSEFCEGIKKLISTGLILQVGKNYKTSESFKEWFRGKFNKKIRMNVEKEFRGIENHLSSNFENAKATNSDHTFEFSEEEFKRIVAEYFVAA